MDDNKAVINNRIIPKYVPANLKWHERDGLDTWYLQGKCQDFLQNTDSYFENVKVTNFDIINNKLMDLDKKKQYETVNFNDSNDYPIQYQVEINDSIFRHINQNSYHVQLNDAKQHFNKNDNKRKAIGRGRFLKLCSNAVYAKYW